MMDGNESTDYKTITNHETDEMNLVIIHPEGKNDTVTTGTDSVPKFPYSVSLLLVALGGVIVLVRMLLIQQEKLACLIRIIIFRNKVFSKAQIHSG